MVLFARDIYEQINTVAKMFIGMFMLAPLTFTFASFPLWNAH